jgi:hypothetical protein
MAAQSIDEHLPFTLDGRSGAARESVWRNAMEMIEEASGTLGRRLGAMLDEAVTEK